MEKQVKIQDKSKGKNKKKDKRKLGVKTKKNFGKKVFKPKQNKNKEEKAVIDKLQAKYNDIDVDKVNTFDDLPLSANTLKGLRTCNYLKPTDIQKQTIKLALTGEDVLGAAQTGSGKTLAFLIPVLERLYIKQWTKLDGIGAVIITPTRELAYQIFKTLEQLALPHRYTTGFVVGGKDLRYEWSVVGQCNIIVCTPGRLLQHMDENSSFDCVNLEVLVLDEADRCLDMGFQQTMNAIIANLPPTRQTLLFSATQTKSVKDLARLSLKNPRYVSVHEHFTYSTPEGLQQNYVVCELKDKVSMLWSFIKNNPKQKIIIFLASCKQVKYLSEIFTRNRSGTKIMALYGTLHQMRRLDIYNDFCNKTSAVLFATDIAARGLDFPEVHWVVQGDCPEDAETYIHRVGRTARFHRGGKSLLLLMPSELSMLDDLKEKKVPIQKHNMDQTKIFNPVRDMKKYLAQSEELTDTARRAFLSYVKSVVHMKNKKIFDVKALDTDSFAHSLGLVAVPKIRFLKKMMPTKITHNTKISFVDEQQEKSNENELVEEIATKFKKPITSQTVNAVRSFATTRLESDSEEDEDEFEFAATLNKESHDYLQTDSTEILEAVESGGNKNKMITKAAAVKKLMKKKIKPNTKIIFDDEGKAVKEGMKSAKSQLAEEYENEIASGVDLEKSKLVLKAEDKFDKQLFKQKVQSKHKQEKQKLKAQKKKEEEEKKAQKEQDELDESGCDGDSGEEPDLSWLPDPDKVFGKSTGDEDDDEEMTALEKQEETKKDKKQNKESKKRKLEEDGIKSLKRKKKKLSQIGTSLNVNEAEELAVLLLRNK